MGLIETTKEERAEGQDRTMTAERQRESDLDNGRWVRDWGDDGKRQEGRKCGAVQDSLRGTKSI